MQIRPYQPSDTSACLAAFTSNLPRFFAPYELAEFVDFLASLPDPGPYFVVESRQKTILGCGGYSVMDDLATAGLMWGLVHREHHGQGIGRALLLARLFAICQRPNVKMIVLDTTQHSYGFFAAVGFRTTSIQADFYGPGLDRHDMQLNLTQAKCTELAAQHEQHGYPFVLNE